jgi:hypothetical protein
MKEIILASAVKYGEIIFVGKRHFDVIMSSQIMAVTGPDKMLDAGKCIQGFITNTSRFVTRQEAWYIAETANQIVQRVGGDNIGGGRLFSENIFL